MAPTHEWTVEAAPAGAGTLAERATFLKRTYGHLLGAVMAFVIAELALFQTGFAEGFARTLMNGKGTMTWLLVMGGFMIVGVLANKFAMSSTSRGAQYGGLALYVVAEGILFAPMLWIANAYFPGAITSAAMITLVGFTGLTAVVLLGKGDFSFLGSLLKWGGILALVAIVGAAMMGSYSSLGLWFSIAMVGLAGAFILYDTSNVLHHYPTDRYVAASLSLFASVALMFWYVLRIVMSSRR